MELESPKTPAETGQMMRRNCPVYDVNPSLTASLPVRVQSKKMAKVGGAYMIAPSTGEVIGRGTFGFVEEKEVDSEEFVKIYLAGIRKYGELSKAGATLFEFVYKEISGNGGKNKDTISVNLYIAQKWNPRITKTTYFRGLNELLEKGFLFQSPSFDTYFVNVRFMFNGDRMALVQTYRRKGAVSTLQAELPFDDQEGLPAPAQEE